MDHGRWLTAVRVERLPAALGAIGSFRPPGLPVKDADRVVWGVCGGPLADVPGLLTTLRATELIHETNGALALTKRGRTAYQQHRTLGGRRLATALIRGGFFSDQARSLLDHAEVNDDGSLTCLLANARDAAAQLVGVLQRWPDVFVEGRHLRIPAVLVEEIEAPWALLPPSTEDIGASIRKNVGNRAELYTYRLERMSSADPGEIIWVARDDDSLGYDVEDRGSNPIRRIEVKGSSGENVRFFLTANEWAKAETFKAAYEVQYWGHIDRNQSPAEEFYRLRGLGYPRRFIDPAALVRAGTLIATVEAWRIVEG